MFGSHENAIETVLANSEPNFGYWEDVPINLGDGRVAASGAILSDATDPQFEVGGGVESYIEWAAADTDGVLFLVPSLQLATRIGKLQVVAQVGLIGTNGNNDVDLLITMNAKPRFADWLGLASPTKVTVRTAAADAVASISEMTTPANGARIPEVTTEVGTVEVVAEFDVPAALDPGSSLIFRVVPDQAPGSGNDLRLYSLAYRYPRHASLTRRFDRIPIK